MLTIVLYRYLDVVSEVIVTNSHPTKSAALRIFEPLQLDYSDGNILKPNLHSFSYAVTCTVSNNSGVYVNGSSAQISNVAVLDSGLVMKLPGAALVSGMASEQSQNIVVAQYNLTLHSKCTLTASLLWQKRFLKRDYIPTDASKGFHVGSGVVHWRWQGQEKWECVIPSSLLVSVPFPDASMPFNVITMVSTVLALLLGSMMNVLVRKSSLKKPNVKCDV